MQVTRKKKGDRQREREAARRRQEFVDMAAAFGDVLREELRPLRADINGVRDELRAGLKGVREELQDVRNELIPMKSSLKNLEADVAIIKRVATERQIFTDARLRRLEDHLGLPPLPDPMSPSS